MHVDVPFRLGCAAGRGRGRESGCPLPLPPNRTGGSPASGFPVSGCSVERKRALRTVPKDVGPTFGSNQANCTGLVPPPVSLLGHSRWFVFRISSFILPLSCVPFALRSLLRFLATTDAPTSSWAALGPSSGMNSVYPKPISLITLFGLPAILSPTICGLSEGRGGFVPCRSSSARGSYPPRQASPFLRRLAQYRRPNRVYFARTRRTVLRTGCSRSVALHLVFPRRSYGSIPHDSSPHRSGLAPLLPNNISGARRARGPHRAAANHQCEII
jgi:hypothetical protein